MMQWWTVQHIQQWRWLRYENWSDDRTWRASRGSRTMKWASTGQSSREGRRVPQHGVGGATTRLQNTSGYKTRGGRTADVTHGQLPNGTVRTSTVRVGSLRRSPGNKGTTGFFLGNQGHSGVLLRAAGVTTSVPLAIRKLAT